MAQTPKTDEQILADFVSEFRKKQQIPDYLIIDEEVLANTLTYALYRLDVKWDEFAEACVAASGIRKTRLYKYFKK